MKTWESVPENHKLTKKKTSSFVPPDIVKLERQKEVGEELLTLLVLNLIDDVT